MPERIKPRPGGSKAPAGILNEKVSGSRSIRGPLKEILRRINEKGPITFAEFMDLALYWRDGGYYTSSHERWGKTGDYITNIDISPVFSRLLAKEVHEAWSFMGSPGSFELIEAGAGRGWLSKGILSTLKDLYPDLYRVIKIRLVEKNPYLREPSNEHITWHEEITGLDPVKGCIISNELIDSFPAHRVEERGGLKEVYVGFDGSSLIDVYGPPSTPELVEYFKKAGIELVEGQKAEVNLNAGRWVHTAAKIIDKGFIITIDYGLPARELYAPERKGTLLCHCRHTLNDNPFLNIGRQDITTHVDFTALVIEGRSLGLELTGFTTQKNFLLGLGILDELMETSELDLKNYDRIKHNQALKELVMPGGMGDTFKVLVQHKGMEKQALLGFSFKDMSRCLF